MVAEATAAFRPRQDRAVPRGNGAADAAPTWLLCRAGTVLCALPTEHVIEIMRMLPVEQIAGAPDYVCGISIVRGAPVPVVDVGLIVGGRRAPFTRLVAIRVATRTVALAVDAVVGIARIALDALGRLPPLLGEAAADTVGDIGARDAELLVFLRAGRLVPEDVLALVDTEGATS